MHSFQYEQYYRIITQIFSKRFQKEQQNISFTVPNEMMDPNYYGAQKNKWSANCY
jgi:hypothetical protein